MIIVLGLLTTTAEANSSGGELGANASSIDKDTGSGDKDNQVGNVGDADGIRVSIVSSLDGSLVAGPINLSNFNPNKIGYTVNGNSVEQPTACYGMGFNKFKYKKMEVKDFKTQRDCDIVTMNPTLPKIVYGDEEETKEFFKNLENAEVICKKIGFDFNKLKDKADYCMVIEPFVFFKNKGITYCLTATECGMLGKLMEDAGNKDFFDKMTTLTHAKLPLKLVLKEDQLGIVAYGTGNDEFVSNEQIIANLGIHIYDSTDFGGPPGIATPVVPPDKGYPDGGDDKGKKDGSDDKTSQSDANKFLIPSEYLNRAIHRQGAAEPKPSGASKKVSAETKPVLFGTIAENFSKGMYKPYEWGLEDITVIDRGLTVMNAPSKLKVAGFVHQTTPAIVGWLGDPAKARNDKGRIWDNYKDNINVAEHAESALPYTYTVYDYGTEIPCSCVPPPCTKPGGHGREGAGTKTENSSFAAKVSSYNYSSKNTVFNTDVAVTITPKPMMTFNKEGKRGHYTDVVKDTRKTFTFFPYYKMKYFDEERDVNKALVFGAKEKELWMLATGERTFNISDVIDIDFTVDGEVDMIAPWSRDKKDATLNKNVLKAGSAIQILPPAVKGTVKYTYYVQDPGFKDGNQTIVIDQQAITKFESIFQGDAIDLAVYSNVPYTGSLLNYPKKGTYDCAVNNLVKPGKFNSYRPKPRDGVIATTKTFDHNSIKVVVTRNNSVAGQQAQGCVSDIQGSVKIANNQVNVKKESTCLDVMNVTNLTSLLKQGRNVSIMEPATSQAQRVLGWYKEEYEGLLKVEISGEFTLEEDKSKQTWFEVYPHLSDNITNYNRKENDYIPKASYNNRKTYDGIDFIFGVGLAINPNNTPNGDIIFVPNPEHTPAFQIRGSVYDNAK